MSDRQLAYVATVSETFPIPGADAIECAQVGGWKVVVKKGETPPGSRVVFFETDSLLPVTDTRFAFLASKAKMYNGQMAARLRTVKLRGQLSQGLALPAELFSAELATYDEQFGNEQRSLADIIGVRKYEEEIPVSLAGLQKGNFPAECPRSDQERIQNIFNSDLVKNVYEVTVKCDGTSLTVMAKRNPDSGEIETRICSRNMELKDEPENAGNLYIRATHLSGLLRHIKASGREIAVQAEICGPSIQKNRMLLDTVAVYIYDVFDIAEQRFIGSAERLALVAGWLNEAAEIPLRHAQVLGISKPQELATLDSALDYASALRYPSGALAEGAVYKQIDGKMSFKIISNEYLLKHGL